MNTLLNTARNGMMDYINDMNSQTGQMFDPSAMLGVPQTPSNPNQNPMLEQLVLPQPQSQTPSLDKGGSIQDMMSAPQQSQTPLMGNQSTPQSPNPGQPQAPQMSQAKAPDDIEMLGMMLKKAEQTVDSPQPIMSAGNKSYQQAPLQAVKGGNVVPIAQTQFTNANPGQKSSGGSGDLMKMAAKYFMGG